MAKKKPKEIAAEIAGELSTDRSAEYKQLQKHCEQLEQRLAALSTRKWSIPTAKRVKSTGGFLRLCVPDTHGCHLDPTAAGAFFADIAGVPFREVVLLGDHMDCGGFLSEHHTIGYVAEMEYCYSDDIDAANQFLDTLQKTCPDADHHYLEGNHEHRIEQWAVTRMKNRKDTERQLKHDAFWSVLHLERRGIKWYRASEEYGGIKAKATVKLGNCYFTHGSRTGENAARAMVAAFGGNVVFGHTHRMLTHTRPRVDGGAIGGWSVGCLSKLRPYWRHTAPSEWTHGYAIQMVHADGDFLHIPVPIVEGKSMMQDMMRILIKNGL